MDSAADMKRMAAAASNLTPGSPPPPPNLKGAMDPEAIKQPDPLLDHDTGLPTSSKQPFFITDWTAGHLTSAYTFVGDVLKSSGKALSTVVVPKTAMKDGELAKISEYMAQNHANIDEKQVTKLYESLSAKNFKGPAEVHYDKTIKDLILDPFTTRDRVVLYKYFAEKLGAPELRRRQDVMFLQAKQRDFQSDWAERGIQVGVKRGIHPEELEKHAKVLGMGEYFPAFKVEPGMAKNSDRLQALESSLPQVLSLFKEFLGEGEYIARLRTMAAMDRMMSPDIPASLVTRWREQGLDVYHMVEVIDLTRGHISNPEEYERVSSSLRNLDGTLEEKELTQFLSVEDELNARKDTFGKFFCAAKALKPGKTPFAAETQRRHWFAITKVRWREEKANATCNERKIWWFPTEGVRHDKRANDEKA
ncbi:hypothetical protein VP01_2097g4 [Puccinia sorghi]|uniref:Uncharacterized protein n=1 Tax=Puccinia sorghi TaxID=27349 RepID=A0A0L6VA76_9BASI|nr:hypothetical protein VP01_2097g4 [Puccinia sorghi]